MGSGCAPRRPATRIWPNSGRNPASAARTNGRAGHKPLNNRNLHLLHNAGLLREGRFDWLDVARQAGEIEDAGKSKRTELRNPIAALLPQLAKCTQWPRRRNTNRRITIRNKRYSIALRLEETSGLGPKLGEADRWARVWNNPTTQVPEDPSRSDFPKICPWVQSDVLDQAWLPFWQILATSGGGCSYRRASEPSYSSSDTDTTDIVYHASTCHE